MARFGRRGGSVLSAEKLAAAQQRLDAGEAWADVADALEVKRETITINTLDTDGVPLAAIQGLYSEVRDQRSEFGARMAELEAENARLREELEAIKRTLGL